jgi:hypothetical protein
VTAPVTSGGWVRASRAPERRATVSKGRSRAGTPPMTHRSGHDHDTYSPNCRSRPQRRRRSRCSPAATPRRSPRGRRGAHGRRAFANRAFRGSRKSLRAAVWPIESGLGGTRSNRALQVIQEPTCLPIGFPWSPGLDDAPRERAR